MKKAQKSFLYVVLFSSNILFEIPMWSMIIFFEVRLGEEWPIVGVRIVILRVHWVVVCGDREREREASGVA